MTRCYWTSKSFVNRVFNTGISSTNAALRRIRLGAGALTFLLGAGLIFSKASLADTLTPYKASYQTRVMGISISAERELTKSPDGSYELRMDIKSWLAKITEHSTFTLQDKQIVSHRYRYKQTGIGKNRENKLSFDWQKKIARDDAYKPAITLNIPDNTLDRLNSQLQLRIDLANLTDNNKLPDYTIVDRKRLNDYQFKLLGEEIIKTPLGHIKTLKIERQRENSDRKTFIWYAKEWEYLLVKLVQIEDGDHYELNLIEASIGGKKVTGS